MENACGYQTTSSHNNSLNAYHIFGLIGGTEYRITGSATSYSSRTNDNEFSDLTHIITLVMTHGENGSK